MAVMLMGIRATADAVQAFLHGQQLALHTQHSHENATVAQTHTLLTSKSLITLLVSAVVDGHRPEVDVRTPGVHFDHCVFERMRFSVRA